MTPRCLAVLLAIWGLGLVACGGDSVRGERSEIVDRYRGQGFWCVGVECYRTSKACSAIRSREGISARCQRTEGATCFTEYDRDNLASFTGCYRDHSACTNARRDSLRAYDYLDLSRCVSTR